MVKNFLIKVVCDPDEVSIVLSPETLVSWI